MSTATNGFLGLSHAHPFACPDVPDTVVRTSRASIRDPDFLRRCAWEIGEQGPADNYCPTQSHVGLAAVSPAVGFAHWNLLPEWVDQMARARGPAWHHCRLILRLYDVSFIHFDGLNAHRIQDHDLPSLCGQLFLKPSRPGTWQLAEVGFLLRNGEFIPGARSQTAAFAPGGPSARGSHEGLLVRPHRGIEPIGNVWDHERVLEDRCKPRLRGPLRIGAFAFGSLPSGHDGAPARFVSELAAGQAVQGHEVHVFVPTTGALSDDRLVDGVHYHPLPVSLAESPLETAYVFGEAAAKRLRDFAPFDLVHVHDWMAAQAARHGTVPSVLSLGSIEATRRNGCPPGPLSAEIEEAERAAARDVTRVLTPAWLRDRAITTLGLENHRVEAFPMEGRMPNEWEAPLDLGQVKREINVGPLDRLILYIGPLEHAAGVDLLIEALPVLLRRWGNLHVAVVGEGHLHHSLQQRAHQCGVAPVVRLLGHVEGPRLTRLLRAAQALALPSRYRVPFDDAVVDLARRAGRPVVTTHGGPAHLVRHEETGIITYDNPGSMVWALDRILSDPAHAERMGQNSRRADSGVVVWADVARHYLDLCVRWFPELTESPW
jgi:glycosyltransferase involved in cell wall biosynthesis